MTISNVIHLRDLKETQALKALNRITGLEWQSMPRSLAPYCTGIQAVPPYKQHQKSRTLTHSTNIDKRVAWQADLKRTPDNQADLALTAGAASL